MSLLAGPTMSPREILEFITRHTAHKSTKYISSIAGTDAGNLHSSLAGKRALPFPMAQRVAAAVGLKATLVGNQLAIGVVPRTVINLDVDGAELQSLAVVLEALAGKRLCTWRLVLTLEEVQAGGVFAVAIALLNDAYVVINLTWSDIKEALDALESIRETLPGVWLPEEPEQFAYSTASPEWIRLRAGVESLRTLDAMFLRESEPNIEDWARMLVDLHRMGARPGVVARFMDGIIRSANKRKG